MLTAGSNQHEALRGYCSHGCVLRCTFRQHEPLLKRGNEPGQQHFDVPHDSQIGDIEDWSGRVFVNGDNEL